ncbi:capsule biosynthesis protein [Litoreibacter roseus]|uniref:Capsule biosynthesis protein CapA n=1 Tax=Litoreibacter roseus TaxID=2601869 RepID=A0A6N6JDQ5_9RHOB|nr:capsule biosynthesis protein CapA [Litoreibacter roseus]GFE63509.1 capsule biosynthesis protein CapA [Litoreibacter roseus]
MVSGRGKTFLFLQGPHGPFFYRLSQMLREAGSNVWRIGFNKGDEAFWFDRKTYIPFTGTAETWPSAVGEILTDKRITDVVLYGDTREIHVQAIALAKERGLRIHVFEEGYLRPYWITYERDGSNGHSRLMSMTVDQMRAALEGLDLDVPDAPARWGDMRQHIFYGMAYHFFVLLFNQGYPNFRPHRALSVPKEFLLYLKRLILLPFTATERALATTKISSGGFPYHLCLLQLEHDASFQNHSPFSTLGEFLELVVKGFADGAPGHHHLVFKAHPLEDGRVPIRQIIRSLAKHHGISKRVHYVRGGKLARLLNFASSAVTVNSTAAQQVLWRGLPLKAFGDAVYKKRSFTSSQTLPDFFANPQRPDGAAYRDYRHYLLETSQVTGGYYASRSRRRLLRQVVDMMLVIEDPYDALTTGTATPRQQLHVVG